jgi:hypothetical protein
MVVHLAVIATCCGDIEDTSKNRRESKSLGIKAQPGTPSVIPLGTAAGETDDVSVGGFDRYRPDLQFGPVQRHQSVGKQSDMGIGVVRLRDYLSVNQ